MKEKTKQTNNQPNKLAKVISKLTLKPTLCQALSEIEKQQNKTTTDNIRKKNTTLIKILQTLDYQ